MKRLLIGYDGTDGADAALLDLRCAGLGRDIDAKVLTVADVWLPAESQQLEPVYPDVEPKAVRRARANALNVVKQAKEIAELGRAKLLGIFPNWRIQAVAAADSPAWAIARAGREFRADLIVVGSHGRSVLERLFLGSVAQKVAIEAHCSVHIARPRGDRSPHPLRVLLAVDGSADSDAAIRAVIDRRWPLNAEFKLATVIDHRLESTAASNTGAARQWVLQHDKETREWACRMVEQQARRLHDAGLTVETHIFDGDPKHALLGAARDLNIDCIFIGAHGHDHAGKPGLGTVAAAVMARAHCSVEIVRRG